MQRLSWRLLHPLDSCNLDCGLHETHTYQAYRFLLQQTSGCRDGEAISGGAPAAPAFCLPQPSFPRPSPRGTSVSPTLAPPAARVQYQGSRTVLGAQHGAVGKVWSPAGGAGGLRRGCVPPPQRPSVHPAIPKWCRRSWRALTAVCQHASASWRSADVPG